MYSILENSRILVGALASVVLLSACEQKEVGPPHVRGRGMELATLGIPQQAAVNAAAVSAAFDRDPSLALLADPVYLPRTSGRQGGASVAPALVARMKEQGLVRGTCQTPREGARAVPLCPAAMPGYVVRFSEIFRLGGGADSVEVNFVATRYRSAPKEAAEVMEFERVYQLVRVRGEWRVMREARLPKTL